MSSPCALALALLLDASGSIGDRSWELQVQGHADALADERIQRVATQQGTVAVMVMGFSDNAQVLVPWTLVRSPEEMMEFARRVAGIQRPFSGGTHTGLAVQRSLEELDRVPCNAEREVIDVVTDGRPDDGIGLQMARASAIERGVTINVLAVEGTGDSNGEWAREIATPFGFVLEAPTWAEFARAFRRKLVMELGSR